MDYLCAKFVPRFFFQLFRFYRAEYGQNYRITEADDSYTHATTVIDKILFLKWVTYGCVDASLRLTQFLMVACRVL